ncbi:uncharacterized protein BYT42DRAFT_604917 [Radiomyces spectabilis]|uniref:uncharacterized protein n=1 Tax=Radiomyces spectabilis TaxID=64574 RepID=UPI002220E26A|nr:uncharacterized protein BYT42DRAFT_604917 [Radiomyces spectabilis]KAI8379581.1 hypothetical protein BYT42DRAFT_604917 [Radiomyces spectabilis]
MRFSSPAAVAAVLVTTLATVHCTLAPNYPEPGTVWTAGKEYEILWDEDNTKPTIAEAWRNFRIDLMTGDNDDQMLLANVNLTANSMSYKWVAPDVEPHSSIYFLMFTNEAGDNAWTTRFAIVGADGKVAPPEHPTQPNGEKVPWGVGKVVATVKSAEDGPAANAVSSSASSASASASPSSGATSSSSASASSKASAAATTSAAHRPSSTTHSRSAGSSMYSHVTMTGFAVLLTAAVMMTVF